MGNCVYSGLGIQTPLVSERQMKLQIKIVTPLNAIYPELPA